MNRSLLSIPILAIVVVAVIAIAVSSGGSTTKAQSAVASGSAISLKQTPVGKTLVDARGRTLYLFQADATNVSKLSTAGQAVWPPFTSTVKPQATGGANIAQIGTTAGASGTSQVTYNGHPLYYYVGDHKPGQIAGQGLNEFGARWYVLSSAGAAITSSPTSSSASTATGSGASSGGGSSYGY